ncbi:Zinc finger, C2H2-type/integrase, DNA-binding protein [Metarhizium rileyi]|uniref:Zinc finger, C2H2-type/integrase, DNA-binding protein n=1 Tax=Metarhizium rileyi (strain RCEF 4871) TaxID=1649241 RepID=A0A167AGX5_METRR|nr:Zinc finger, C2H2-type/integrase, DNA-binding protein [Metarhizium rileyi RCEF 4871]
MSSPSATAIPGRSHTRNNSHSLLPSSFNANHRVTRRKSVTNPGPNVAALTAAVASGEQIAAIPIANTGRRNTISKAALAKTSLVGSLPSPPASLPANKAVPEIKHDVHDSAIDDGNDLSADEDKLQKARIRRASDGSPLLKEPKKSNRVEVRCDKCGKSYKHSSCLTKHLWEHTPEWSFTSKLLISKHQQVQLLEAASVLVAMNDKEGTVTPPESTKDSASEPDSSSPAASGYSEQVERQSSADTTPPPMMEESGLCGLSYRDGHGAGFARSYQSAVSSSIPNGSAFGHSRQPSHERRPPSSGANRTGEEDSDLAAAVELLSCSFNSNKGSHNTVLLTLDAPPVPPVPAQYLDQTPSFSSAGFINSFPQRQPESFTRGELRRGSDDVKMEDSDDDFDMQSRARSDEDDDGVFGRMEE